MALMPLLVFLGSHPNGVDVFDWEAAISWGATPTALMFLVGKLRIYAR